jgi:hypothetical protein
MNELMFEIATLFSFSARVKSSVIETFLRALNEEVDNVQSIR